MVDQETQNKLDKLKRLEAKARERSKAWMDKIKADGKKQISAIVTAKVFNEICLRRDRSTLTGGKPLTTGDVIEQALFPDIDAKPNNNRGINTNVSLNVPLNINTNVNSDTAFLKKEESPDKDVGTQPMEDATEPKPPKDANAKNPVDDEPLSEIEPPTAEPSEEPQADIPGPKPDRSDRAAYKKWLVSKITSLRENEGLAWEDVAKKLEEEDDLSPNGKIISSTNAEAIYRRGKNTEKS